MRSFQVIDYGQPLRDTVLPDPSASGHEVVLAVEAAGVCHSDLHIWEGGYDLGARPKLMLKDRGIPLPLTIGHETAGRIIKVGEKVGDRKVGETRAGLSLDRLRAVPRLPRRLRESVHEAALARRLLRRRLFHQIVVPHARYCLPLEGLDPVAVAPSPARA